MKYKILIITYPKIGGCQFYRQVHPHSNFSKHEFQITHRHVLELIPNRELSGYDMVQLHKNYVTPEFLIKLKCLQIPSIVDFDDYWVLPTGHPSFEHYRKSGLSNHYCEILRLADNVSVTTGRLAKEVKRHNKNVYVFPNAIDPRHEYARKVKMPDWEQMQIGYLAGSTHINDIELLRGLNNKLSGSGLEYSFNLFGYKQDTAYQEYAEILTSKGKFSDNLQLYAPLAVPDYLTYYNMIDVSLVSLKTNKFNSLKSELKIIEAGNFSIPVIASNAHPYKNYLKHKRNSLIATSKSDWVKHIKYFVKNPKAVNDYGKQLNIDIQNNFNYGKITKEREEVYKSIIDKG